MTFHKTVHWAGLGKNGSAFGLSVPWHGSPSTCTATDSGARKGHWKEEDSGATSDWTKLTANLQHCTVERFNSLIPQYSTQPWSLNLDLPPPLMGNFHVHSQSNCQNLRKYTPTFCLPEIISDTSRLPPNLLNKLYLKRLLKRLPLLHTI